MTLRVKLKNALQNAGLSSFEIGCISNVFFTFGVILRFHRGIFILGFALLIYLLYVNISYETTVHHNALHCNVKLQCTLAL